MSFDSSRFFRPLLVGSGKLARHLHHFLSLRGVPHGVHSESRSLGASFFAQAQECTHIWLLVSDRALDSLARTVRQLLPVARLIHSSAATAIPEALTLHPLMTFGPALYEESAYNTIPWTLFEEELAAGGGKAREQIEEFLKRLPNPVRILRSAERTRYHLSCVMFSNLSLILWEAAARTAPSGMAPADYRPILQRSLENFMQDGLKALTGPLVRGDLQTLSAHEKLLGSTPESELYAAFTRYFSSMSHKKEPLHVDHRT
jgi:predicted short-subunit dehydrogenase-like oxidoreductase (DUF2520 family)